MNKSDAQLSLQFYQYLCNIIGSEDVVKRRRKIFCAIDYVSCASGIIGISSGSKAEGIDLQGSDYDQMNISRLHRVYESLDNISSRINEMVILMDITDTKPGFTKLKLCNKSHRYMRTMFKSCDIIEGKPYISSKLFRESMLPDNMIIHGPCISTDFGTYDMARCFQCKEWIEPANKWISRSRSSWPDNKLVTCVVKEGVLFVPIGCKGSLNEDLEWRISFSMAEKQLIYSFTHTQLLCYALLKIILKDIIKKKHSDLICSYFLKTIMFWLCEESSPLEWHPGNMIPCFVDCFKRLIYCVEYKTCLLYFIPENNLFEGRFTDLQHKALLDTLYSIYHSLWTTVIHTPTFQNYRTEQIASPSSYLKATEFPCLIYCKILFGNPIIISNMKQLVTRLINLKDKELSSYFGSRIFSPLIQITNHNNFTGKNKSTYKEYQRNIHYAMIGISSDAASAWLLLASLFYKYRRFHECMDILNYVFSKCSPDKIMLHYDNSLIEQTFFQKIKESGGLLLACKYLILGCVPFDEPFNLLPIELSPLIEYNNNVGINIPPVVYLDVLSFLCFHHLRDQNQKSIALQNLEITFQEMYFVTPNRRQLNIANNCLQIAKNMM